MRIPLDWLGEYVDLPNGVTGEEVAASLVAVGLEEEGLHTGGVTGPLVVGRVLTLDPEEQKNGKTINWCTVDVGDANGTGEPQGIVCGAHNFVVGDLVVVILPGGVLPGDFVISARKTYGHVSAGMICSVSELGIGEDHDGILVLNDRPDAASLQPGQDAIGLLGLDRETVEINVTPDRGYCFSIRGVAREYHHATGAAFTDPTAALDAAAPGANDHGHPVELRDDAPLRGRQGCGRYVARVVRGVDATAPTPDWMATRLTEAGMRPISLPVDVTNYVMLGLGQPLHAFDLASLTGPIVVRRARDGERLTTLDGHERTLHPEDLLITDGGETPLGLAGVMGGESSEVVATSTDLLIEAAHFDATTAARTARRHRLPSEASKRFERGVDPRLPAAAAQWAVDLLVEYGGATADEGVTDVGEAREPAPVPLPLSLPTRLVGVEYEPEQIGQILTDIGCQISSLDDATLSVTPPSWRPDLTTGADLVEEVARIAGYDQIPSVLPVPTPGRGLSHDQRLRRLVAEMLAGQGLAEVWNAPFVGDAQHTALGLDAAAEARSAVRLANPLSDEQPLFRTRILTGLVDTLRRNVARGQRDVALFEVGVVARGGDLPGAPTVDVGVNPDEDTLARIHAGVPKQPRHLGIVLAGDRDRAGWWGSGRAADVGDLLDLVAALGESLALDLRTVAADVAPYHPGRCAAVTLADGTPVGHLGELHPTVVAATGLPERALAAELDLDVLIAAGGWPISAETLSSFPVANLDVALVVDESVPAADVAAALREGAGPDLESLALFDVYRGEQAGTGSKSLAYRLVFRAPDRTLTTEEAARGRDSAVQRAAALTGARQR